MFTPKKNTTEHKSASTWQHSYNSETKSLAEFSIEEPERNEYKETFLKQMYVQQKYIENLEEKIQEYEHQMNSIYDNSQNLDRA